MITTSLSSSIHMSDFSVKNSKINQLYFFVRVATSTHLLLDHQLLKLYQQTTLATGSVFAKEKLTPAIRGHFVSNFNRIDMTRISNLNLHFTNIYIYFYQRGTCLISTKQRHFLREQTDSQRGFQNRNRANPLEFLFDFLSESVQISRASMRWTGGCFWHFARNSISFDEAHKSNKIKSYCFLWIFNHVSM